MFNFKRWAVALASAVLVVVALAACQPEVQTIIETRVVETIVTVEGKEVVVTTVVEVTPVPEEMPMQPKDLIVCMAQEPDTLYPFGGSMLAGAAVQHAIFENNFTTLSFGYQAQGIAKIPSLADGDAVINVVDVTAGDMVVDAAGDVVELAAGVSVVNAAGETVEYADGSVSMEQMVVDFAINPRVWSDGVAVSADDSVYSFEIASDPDTPTSKYGIDRTASYEANGDLATRWTGLPGFKDSTYFTNFYSPYPRHAWGEKSAAELLEWEGSNRTPMGDGAFVVEEWVAGDNIRLVRNPYYYRADEGLPYLDSVTYKFIPDTNALVAQLLSGQCDIGTQDGMDVGQSPFLLNAESQGLLTPYFQTGTVYEHIDFGINSYGDYGDGIGRPDWFEDVRVRQAMTMCTDRAGMVDSILYGKSEVIHSYIPSVHPLYPDGLTEWPYDVDAANALLDEAGFVDSDGDGWREDPITGVPFAVTLGTTTGNEMRQQLTQIFKENQIDCGIDIELYYLPAGEWFSDGPEGPLFGRTFDLGEFAWLTGVEPSCGLYQSDNITGPEEEGFGGWGNASETGWMNDEFDAHCKKATGSLPGTADYENGHKDAQRVFSQEVPVIPLFLRLKVAAARPEVKNFGVDPTQNSELYNIYMIDLDN